MHFIVKKGFTLIELLAVIVILGIITLIAVPVVTNILKESKKSAFLTSMYNVNKEIENECHLNIINKTDIFTIYDFTNYDLNYLNENIKG